MATNILKIFNKKTNTWEAISGVGLGLGSNGSSPSGQDLSNYYKKSEIDDKLKNVKASSIKEWNNTDTFKKGDLILYKGYLFRATEDSTNVEPTIDSKTSPYYSKEEINDILEKRPLYNPNLLMNGNFCSFERQNAEFFDLQNMNNTDYLTDRWQVFSSVNDLK